MKRHILLLLLTIIFIDLYSLEYVPGQMIVKTSVPRNITDKGLGLADFDQYLSEKQVNRISPLTNKQENRFYLVSVDEEPDWDSLSEISFKGIKYIQPNYINTFYMMPDDPYFISGDQWAFYQEDQLDINATEAWDYTTGNSEILIGLVDSGLHFDHPDITQNVFYNDDEVPDDGIDNDGNGYIDDWRGWDFVDAPELSDIALGDYYEQDNDPSDDLNHGTHLTGILAADTDNALGVAGLCWNVSVIVIRAGFKTIDGVGYLQDDDAAAGIIYAADMGADVINVSWGDENYSQIIADACDYAYQKGSIIVASSGNTYGPGIMYPAHLASTICVGSVDRFFNRASFSSYGPQLDLVAPGVSILSSYDVVEENQYKEQSGTSMSAPFVTAAIALLLSVESDLNFNDVRTRLNSSCHDLGDFGYDNEYGNGLLDVRAFLTNTNCPQLELISPVENQGFNDEFDIVGTVLADNLSRYTVMYTDEEIPDDLDWHDVSYPHSNTPQYYFYEVDNDILAHFDFQGISQEFNEYKLKIELMTTNNQHYDLRCTIFIDKTPPLYFDEFAAIMKRYGGEYVNYYMQSGFNEPVNLEVYYTQDNDQRRDVSYSSFADSIQIVYLPRPEPEDIDLHLIAENICGLTLEIPPEDNSYYLPDDYITVPVNGYTQENLGNQLVTSKKTLDVDGNGMAEFLALEIYTDNEEEEQVLGMYEVSGNNLIMKHLFSYDIWPQDIGYTAENDFSILGVDADLAVLYTCMSGSTYPNSLLWLESNVYGGNLVDIDDDGIDEIAIIKNETVNNVTKRVLALYKRYGSGILRLHTIFNETPTAVKNEFVNKICCGKIDEDDYPELLLTDTDGDVMLIENDGYPNEYQLKYYTRLPVANAYYSEMGDFTGDGNLEFCVGGFSRNYADPAKTFSFFSFYHCSGSNDFYENIGYLSFDQVEAKNSIASGDMDGDGDKEIILSLPPNAYVIDYIDGIFTPSWIGESSMTFQNVCTVIPDSEFEIGKAIVNTESGDSYISSVITKDEEFYGPPTPTNYIAYPLDENRAFLSWEWLYNEADCFNVYRRYNNEVTFLGSVNEHRYFDLSLTEGDTLYYQVTAIDSSYSPLESESTLWKMVIPKPIPQLEEIEMSSASILTMNFDQKLSNDALSVFHYKVNNNVNWPVSVNFINEKTGLVISFSEPLPPFDQYLIAIDDLTGDTGVPFPDGEYQFDFKEDVVAPRILRACVVTDREVEVYFNEPLNVDTAQNLDNYIFVPPSIDLSNQISSISYQYSGADSSWIILTLGKEMVYSNQRYFLRVENIEDLSGNTISNNGNKCRFSLTDITDLKHLSIYPNPFYPEQDYGLRFTRLPLGIKGNIWIYDLAGDLVYEEVFGPLTESEMNNFFAWDGKNDSGKRVSSGIYFYVLRMGGNYKKGKFALIN